MAKNRIADNGDASPAPTETAAPDPKKLMAEHRAKVHAEYNRRLAELNDEFGIDIVPHTVLQAKFRQ